jgi:hypothetical protein
MNPFEQTIARLVTAATCVTLLLPGLALVAFVFGIALLAGGRSGSRGRHAFNAEQ